MKKHIFRLTAVLFVLALSLNQVFAVPAYRSWQSMTQPDGTTITIRQMGDEFFHYWENEEGQQVAKDEQGFWRVKETPAVPDEEMRKKQASRQYNQHVSKPRKAAGAINLAPRGLVILVNYTDVTYRSENTQSAMSDLMNSENYTYNSATGSVREFFKVQSNGAYMPDFDVAGPYTLAHNRAYYGANDAKGNDVLPGDMIVEACKLADADGVDFTKYNNDGDNYVDFVYVIYAGEGAADSDEADAIWPHNWTLSSARYYNNCTYSASQSRVDGLYINNYACSGELKGRSTTRCPIGTITHEFGHVLGLPDYYVTDDEASNAGMKYTPGAWHIMDYGSYNNDGRTPPNYSPHDKYYFGWSTPTLLAKDAQKNCTLTTTYGSAYQITGGSTLKGATASDRIWYLENRQKSGWDKYLPGHGLVVWEVTYNSDDWENNEPNNENIGYTIVTANSLSRPYKPCVYSTTASSTSGTTFPGTSNKTSYTPATGCDLTEITESGGNITFKYNGGVVKTRATYEFETDHCTAPANGDVAINDPLSVTITPNSGYTLDDASCWMVEMGGVLLTYGTGFTYNASTNTFHIASLTDDVVILAEAKVVRTVTWSVQGNTSTTTFADGAPLVLPSQPEDCSGTGGKKFVGWTTSSTVSGSAPSDLFTEASGVVTADATYYAVYATASGSGGSSGAVTITTSTANIPTGYGSANTFTEYTLEGYKFMIQQMYLNSGKLQWRASGHANGTGTMYNNEAFPGEIASIVLTYNSSDGNKNFTVKVGNSSNPTSGTSITPSTSGSVYTFDCSSANADYFVLTNGLGAGYLDQIVINYGSGTTYSEYSLTCSAPVVCALTGITLNTSGVTTGFTTGDAFSSEGLVVTANYSNCSSKTVTPETISSPDMSTAGTKTITVSYTENGTTRTATYSITVSDPVTHTVTWSVNGTATPVVYNDGQALALPSTPSDCAGEGGKKFVGWTASSSVSGSAPADLFTEASGTVTADVTYYAVYATAGGGSGTPSSATYAFSNKSWNASPSNWTSGKDGAGFINSGVQVTTGATGANATCPTPYSNISSIVVSYCTNGSSGAGSITMAIGSITLAESVTKMGGTTARDLTFDFSSSTPSGTPKITVTCTTNSIYVCGLTINYGGGGTSYSDYSLTCTVTPPTPTYTVTWISCGEPFDSKTYSEGEALVLPSSTPSDNAGKSFVGWTATEHYTGASAPALISAGGAVNADATYYAVFH